MSRAFSSHASIAPATREKILAAAAELNYRPNKIPAIMLSGKSRMIGVVIGGLSNPFYASALECLASDLQASGLQILLVHVESALTLDSAINQLMSYRIDAIVTSLAIGSKAVMRDLSNLRIPVICFNSLLTGPWISTVVSNNYQAGCSAARLLMKHGVTQPVWLAGPKKNAASRLRGKGFREGLKEESGSITSLVELRGDDTYESGYSAVASFLKQGCRPDGMFCSNDMMACGAIDALREHADLRCPDDIVLIGYDNIPQGAWRSYDLTTFDQRSDLLVQVALELLNQALIEETEPRMSTRVIDAQLIERGSTERHL